MKGCKRDYNPRPCRWQSKRRTNADSPKFLERISTQGRGLWSLRRNYIAHTALKYGAAIELSVGTS